MLPLSSDEEALIPAEDESHLQKGIGRMARSAGALTLLLCSAGTLTWWKRPTTVSAGLSGGVQEYDYGAAAAYQQQVAAPAYPAPVAAYPAPAAQAYPAQPAGAVPGYPAQGYPPQGYPAQNAYAPTQPPLEFSASCGPRMVAGTKVVNAGADDLGVGNEYTHDPPTPPPASYAKENPPITVMLYRAQSDKDYPQRNVNVADLAGAMWYLHNEIIGFPDPDWRIRHFNITRILRYKAVIWNPREFFVRTHTTWGPFVAFNAGKCDGPNCDTYQQYGAVVGCQLADPSVANYHNFEGKRPVWISLPGPCPLHEYGAKKSMCMSISPGGDCGMGNPITGARDCTYMLQDYGQVRLDELLPSSYGRRVDFRTFFDLGGREYDKATDRGTYTTFWDGIHDEAANRQRMEAVVRKFDELYPQFAGDSKAYDEIKCDTI